MNATNIRVNIQLWEEGGLTALAIDVTAAREYSSPEHLDAVVEEAVERARAAIEA